MKNRGKAKMKKFWKRIVVLVLILFCSYQSLFADYQISVTITVYNTVNAPHQNENGSWNCVDENGNNSTMNLPDGADGTDPQSYGSFP